jgi:hypothetical protein
MRTVQDSSNEKVFESDQQNMKCRMKNCNDVVEDPDHDCR